MNAPVKFIPLNPQEHDNLMRSIIISHMGTTQGNPTQWVVEAVHEAFQRGFGMGYERGQITAQARRPQPIAPEALPPGMRRIGQGPVSGDALVDVELPRHVVPFTAAPRTAPDLIVKDWNDKWPVGTWVAYREHAGAEPLEVATKGKAQVLNGLPVLWLSGFRGAVPLTSCTPRGAAGVLL